MVKKSIWEVDLDVNKDGFFGSLNECETAEDIVVELLVDILNDGYDVENLLKIAMKRFESRNAA